jgi:HEAT repeat protein
MTEPRMLALAAADRRRLAEVEQLVQAGASGFAGLLALLSESSWAVRREVVAALALLGEVSAGPLCRALATERDNEARIAAIVDSLVLNSADLLAQLRELARTPNPAVVADAALILGRRRDRRAIPILAPLVSHADDNVAVAAIEALGRIGGPSAVETLIEAVQSGSFFRAFPAIDVLGRSGDPRVIAPLSALLEDPMYVLEAARALGKTAQAAAAAPLARLLFHPSEGTLRVASLALAELHARHRERYGGDEAPEAVLQRAEAGAAVPRLVRSLASGAPEEQAATAFVLGVIGGESAAAALSSLLDAPGAPGAAAAHALERLGTASDVHVAAALHEGSGPRRQVLLPVVSRSSVAPQVVECLADPDPQVRRLACEALARTGAAQHVSSLFALLVDEKPGVVQAAIGAIQSLGSSEAQRLALEGARSSDPALRRAALRILGYFGFPEALPCFVAALSDGDPRSVDAALSGLAYLDRADALDVLLQAAQSPRDKTRQGAMRALGQTQRPDPRVAPRLHEGLSDRDAWVRYYACQAAGRLALEGATDAIIGLLADAAGQVRVAAVEALSHLRDDRALRALCTVAAGDEPDLRRAALIGLGMSQRAEGHEILRSAARAADPATRLVAISALAQAQAPGLVPALAQAARDADESVRAAALGFLAQVPEASATEVLLDLLGAAGDEARIRSLLSRPAPGRVPALLARLQTADESSANQLCSLLARLRTAEGTLGLLEALHRGSFSARKAAAAALVSLRTRDALEAVRRSSTADEDPRVRQICRILLGQ